MVEDNIVGFSMDVFSPDECQQLCINEASASCGYFSHLGSQCFLLTSCDSIDLCEGCVSGPISPLLDDCQETTTEGSGWETTTEGSVTTTAGTDGTTTVLTTATAPTTTETTTTTTTTETTTTALPACNVTQGLLCDAQENLIMEVEHLNTASDCQAICQNEAECNYWSHWREEGGEHWGRCQLHYNCDRTTDKDCEDCFKDGVRAPKCSCMYGTPLPDLDACDDGEVHLPCEDDFLQGTLCDRHDNEIIHVTHLPVASDCQALCQNHPECNFFSHRAEHDGECWLHTQCDQLTSCDPNQSCIAGPKYPDMDDCSQPEM